MNNWERMKAGRLYNADSKDLEQYHKFGMETCDKFNRTPLWRKKRKYRPGKYSSGTGGKSRITGSYAKNVSRSGTG